MADLFIENSVNDYEVDCLFVDSDRWEERQEVLRQLYGEEINEEECDE